MADFELDNFSSFRKSLSSLYDTSHTDVGQHLLILLLLLFFSGLYVLVLLGMLACGYQYVLMSEYLVQQDGRLARLYRFFFSLFNIILCCRN